MPYKFKYGESIIEVPKKSDITWNNMLNKPSTFNPSLHYHDWNSVTNKPNSFNPLSHEHNYSTWIGAQLATYNGWLGFYDKYKGTRKGWIGHDNGTDFIFANETSGKFYYNTSVDINGWIYPQEIKCMAGNEITFKSSNNTVWFGYRRSGSSTININDYRFGDNQGNYGTIIAKVSNPSDRKIKKDITKISKAKEFILGLKPVEYTYKKGKRRNMGFIAQEVSKLCHELKMGDMSLYKADVMGELDESGKPQILYYDHNEKDDKLSWTLDYTQCIAPLVATVQEQQKEIYELKFQIREMKSQLNCLKRR